MNTQALLAIVASYLLGSIPAALIAGKAKGVDLRKHGSGNLGATNVMRVLGTKIGITVFLFDMAKGGVPVYFLPRWAANAGGLSIDPALLGVLCGAAAIFGHVRPIYLKFGKGGKGVATAAGVFLALAPFQAMTALLIFAVVLLVTGYVSLGSLTATAVLPILLGATLGVRSPVFPISVVLAMFVFWTHRANIARLRAGEEHRFGKKGKAKR